MVSLALVARDGVSALGRWVGRCSFIFNKGRIKTGSAGLSGWVAKCSLELIDPLYSGFQLRLCISSSPWEKSSKRRTRSEIDIINKGIAFCSPGSLAGRTTTVICVVRRDTDSVRSVETSLAPSLPITGVRYLGRLGKGGPMLRLARRHAGTPLKWMPSAGAKPD